ncbi:cysteine-rich receptor-like protein kinase 25 isoform X2 [Vigna unguiculata]|uniref:cysteine-rich receptor-like protein kinase 25 isoform X2 n=1 Tax=Vigna unguiculata TaxID=3917 RepID=UPI001015F2D8|nr:cysteine-rich receptor-like protein kinase 25 isoform X2 [Vigna unguiculata]
MASNNLVFLIFSCTFVITLLNFPTTKAQNEDRVYFEYQNCSPNRTSSTSAYQNNLITLLSSFTSNASATLFYNTTILSRNNTVYGLFMCRGDIPLRLCKECVANATEKLSTDPECKNSVEAVMWYAECKLRYSNVPFFSVVATSPGIFLVSPSDVTTNSTISFMIFLRDAMNRTAEAAAVSDARFSTKETNLSHSQTVYTLAQCTQDLSPQNCRTCLAEAIKDLPTCCDGKQGGRVVFPSCNIWYEMYLFYGLITDNPPQRLAPSSGKGLSRTIILILIFAIALVGLLFGICCYILMRRKTRKSNNIILIENLGLGSSTIESLQFSLAIIEVATNNFADDNKIGKGGFGEVYKGILIDGTSIAVKRLSRNSKQGLEEFKNEVMLIAKLQHRNLVAFKGFCLDEEEKILIYEYVPNKSLDYFLFDTKQEDCLTWSERYKIIEGIAKGILYLHDHSRLKILDLLELLKKTNKKEVQRELLEHKYAMFGQFSEKSDVYSFGVMILEIISGKKNMGSYEPHRIVNYLLNFVWEHWRDETPLSTLDPKLKGNHSNIEVIRCVKIGLLCVQENPDARPTMLTIVSYLNGHLVELPSPLEPTFSLDRRTNPTNSQNPSLRQFANNFISGSINEMSISKFYPR